MEAQLRLRLQENIHSQATLDKFMPLVNYYLAGTGGTLVAVLKTAFNIDVLKLLSKVDTTREQLLDVSVLANLFYWRPAGQKCTVF